MEVTNGALRLRLGGSHEAAVAERLEALGWLVQPWGQGILIPEVRAALSRLSPPSMWRWTPDLIAIRGRSLVLVDPKTTMRQDTPNFAIEQMALITHLIMECSFGIPIVYVFSDFTGNQVSRLRVMHRSLDATRLINGGSGTPMVLVRKDEQLPFEKLFGVRTRADGV